MKNFENMKFLNCSQTRPINPDTVQKLNLGILKLPMLPHSQQNFLFKWEKSPKESCPKSKKVVGRKGWPRSNPEGYWSIFFKINP
jgi:hypothetical protein